MKMLRVLTASLFLIGGAGCTSTGTMPAPTGPELIPVSVGGERFFRVDWQPGERKGRPIVSGTVYNRYGATAIRVQLLVVGLDDRGAVVGQEVVWLGGDVAPFGRQSFEVPVTKFPKYRVSVFAYDWRGKSAA
jgi:hypothetical protein